MRRILLSFALSAVFLTGCASIVKGSTQDIAIATQPEGARFLIKDNRRGNTVREGVTPGSITLEKGAGYFKGASYTVSLSKEGYAPQQVNITSSTNGWYLGGNLVFGGLIGWVIVDPLTGAMWTLAPEGIQAKLAANQAVTPPMAPAPQYAEPMTPTAQTAEPAAPTVQPTEPAAPTVQPTDAGDKTVNQRLEELKERRVQGLISGEEYLAERNRIIYGQ